MPWAAAAIPMAASAGASLIGGGGGAQGASEEERAKALGYLQSLPGYEFQDYASPTLYPSVEERQYQTIADSPEQRAMQESNLGRMDKLGREGMDEGMIRKYITGSRKAGEAARGSEEAIMRDMARRGMGGSGMEVAGRMAARQNETQRISEEMAGQAEADAQLKALMTEASFRGAGALRGQDTALREKNSDIINRYNELNSRLRQEQAQQNIDMTNQDVQRRAGMKQSIQMGNVDLERANAQQKSDLMLHNEQRALQQGAGQAGQMRDIYGALGTGVGGMFSQPVNQPTFSPTEMPQLQQPNGPLYGGSMYGNYYG